VLRGWERPWARRGLAAAIGVLLAVQGVVVAAHSRDQATPVSVDVALDRFRSSTASPSTSTTVAEAPAAGADPAEGDPTQQTGQPPAGETETTPVAEPAPTPAAPSEVAPEDPAAPEPAPQPRPGVYTYRTDGYEKVDALGGRTHTYPQETTITYWADGCGVRALWAPLEQRYDERLLCAGPGGTEMRWFESSHAFFGQTDTRRVVCDAPSVVHPSPATPGQEWTFRCADERTDAISRSRVVGVVPVTVGASARPAVHLEVTTSVTGDSRAESKLEVWLDQETGLALRQIFALDGTSPGPSGDVTYTERYELVLTSVEPRT
jgi:hypothetical protein